MTSSPESTGADRLVYHYTDADGFKAIATGAEWRFVAGVPRRRENPFGAYFTNLPPDSPDLCARLGVSREKSRFHLSFLDAGDLLPLNLHRPLLYQHKFLSPTTYVVPKARQRGHGENPSWR